MFRSTTVAIIFMALGASAFQPAKFGHSMTSLPSLKNGVKVAPLFETETDVEEQEAFFPAVSTPAETPVVNAVNGAVAAPVIDYSKIAMIDTPADAFQTLVKKGKANAEASSMKTLVSAMLGGAYVGMGGMLSLAISGNMAGIGGPNPGLAKLTFALLFPVNLLLALQCGGQLFTGNTANMAAAVSEKKATMKDLLRSWGLSFTGNLIACASFAFLCKYSGVLSGGAAELAVKTLKAKTSLSLGPLLVRAMLCNWLVCLAVYLSMQAKDLTGKYFGILLPISTFVAIGFEHSVANMFLLPAGLLCTSSVSLTTVLFKNLIPVALGNALSGSLLVGTMFSYMFGRLGKEEK